MNIVSLEAILAQGRHHVITWMLSLGILYTLFCQACQRNMTLTERHGTHIDGYIWQCDGCRKRRSLRTNSLFGKFSKTSVETLTRIVYFWSQGEENYRIAGHVDETRQLVGRVCKELRRTCSLDIVRRPFIPFGGPNYVCKCDESMFNHKTKYQRGRRAANKTWVFGICSNEFTPTRGYYQVVERRNRDSLIPVIQMILKPGSELHTDDWPAYNNLHLHAQNVARHRVVVHADSFVDPVTGVHTQNVESGWARLKGKIKAKKGLPPHRIQSFLDEQMWFDHRGLNNRFYNFVSILAIHYQNYPQ